MNKDSNTPAAAAISFADAPTNFARCTMTGCPRAATCLRGQAWAHVPADAFNVVVLNPRLATADAHCPHFRPAQTRRMARGFKQMQARMLPDVYYNFRKLCYRRMTETKFYRLRCGTQLLTPDEQAFICQAARQAGLAEEISFDAYIDVPNWND